MARLPRVALMAGAILAASLPERSAAQSTAAAALSLRSFVTEPTLARGHRYRIRSVVAETEGTLQAVRGDTLIINDGRRVRGYEIDRDVVIERASKRKRGILRAVGGAVVIGAIGYGIGSWMDETRELTPFNSGPLYASGLGGLSAVFGALYGYGTRGYRWEPVRLTATPASAAPPSP